MESETLIQALKVETANRDTELEALIVKWKTATRLAAEEIFGGVRDRVNRMGGVGAWREREKERRERFGGWGEEEANKKNGGEDGAELEEDEKEALERRREEVEGFVDVDIREEGAKSMVEDQGNDDDVSSSCNPEA